MVAQPVHDATKGNGDLRFPKWFVLAILSGPGVAAAGTMWNALQQSNSATAAATAATAAAGTALAATAARKDEADFRYQMQRTLDKIIDRLEKLEAARKP